MAQPSMKVGTKEEALWTKVKGECEALIKQYEDSLTIQKEMLKLAKHKILLEQRK